MTHTARQQGMAAKRARRRGEGPWIRGCQGFALVTVLTLTMVLALLSGLAMNASSSFLSQTVAPYVRTIKALDVAEGGAQLTFQWMKSQYWLLSSSYLTLSATTGTLVLSTSSTAVSLPGNHPDPYTDITGTTRSVLTSFNNVLTSKALGDGSFSATSTLLSTTPEQWSVISTGTVSGVSRTVTLRLRRGPYHPDAAVVTGGNLNISGHPTVNGTLGSVHSNANLSLSGNPTIAVDATASGTYSQSGTPSIGGLAAGSQPTMYIPPVTPASYQQYATYELRSDGNVYCGQAGAAVGCTPGVVIVGGLSGWSYNASQGLWSQSGNTATNGALYVQGGASISGSPGSSSVPWQLTLIATGSITVSGSPAIQSYTQNLLFIAGGNVVISGSFTQYGPEAVIAAHQEVQISGTPTIKGTVVAEGSTSVDAIVGNPTITYSGTLGPSPLPGPLKVVARSEKS